MLEIWEPIIEANGDYDVSNIGRVRSWVKSGKLGNYRLKVPKIIKPQKGRKGYQMVGFRNAKGRVYRHIARLMLQAFKPILNESQMQASQRGNADDMLLLR